VDFQRQRVIIQPGKKETLHVYSTGGEDIEEKVKGIFEKEGITYKFLRKDANKELYIFFFEEAMHDKALEVLTTGPYF
jgi:hypothetical protein